MDNVKVGDWCAVRGQGPMQVEELPEPPRKTTVTMRTVGGNSYWAGTADLRPLDLEFIDTYERDGLARGLFPVGYLDRVRRWLQGVRS